MSTKKTLLEKIINTVFGEPNKKKEVFKRRSLSIESLETRELLSVSHLLPPPLLPEMFQPDDTAYIAESSSSVNVWTVNAEVIANASQENTLEQADSTIPTGLRGDYIRYDNGDIYSTTIRILWDKVDTAVSYKVQQSLDAVTWSDVGTTTTAEYGRWNLQPGIEYYYRVASVDVNGHVSEYSAPFSWRTLVPTSPPVLAVASRTVNSVTLQWDAVDNALEYTVAISKDNGQTWQWKAATPATSYLCTLSSPDDNSLFRVSVTKAETGYCASPVSNVVAIPSYEPTPVLPKRPSGLIVVPKDSSRIEITWNAVTGAATYQLERATSANGLWSTIYEGAETSFTNSGLEADTFYYYRVSAVNDIGSSQMSYAVSALTANASSDPKTPTGFTSSNRAVYSGVTLTWNAVADAVSYRIQYSTDGITWKLLINTAALTYTASDPPSGVNYYYRVASIDSENTVSEYSAAISGRRSVSTNAPVLTEISRTQNAITLQWNEVDNAVNYYLYVSKDGGQTWQSASAYTRTTSYICNISADPDAEYLFRIRVWEAEAGYTSSAFSDVLVSSIPFDISTQIPNRPCGLVAESVGSFQIALSWKSVEGADSYNVERSLSPNGSWTTVYEGSDTEWIDSGLDSATFYYYRISASNDVGTSNISYVVSARTQDQFTSPIVFNISRQGNVDILDPLTVYYRLSGSAVLGADYTVSTGTYNPDIDYGTITIPAGEYDVSLELNVIGQLITEPSRTVVLTVLDGIPDGANADYHLGTLATANAFIVNTYSSSKVWITAVQDAVEDGQDGFIRLQRDNTASELTIRYRFTIDVTTVIYGDDGEFLFNGAASDFSTVTFTAGQEFVDILIGTIDNAFVESERLVGFELLIDTGFSYQILGSSTADLQIHDNDIAPAVWIDSIQNGTEGGNNGSFRLRRDNTANPLTVYLTFGGTALMGEDYLSIPTSVTFAHGQEYIDIPIIAIDDTLLEEDETIIVTIQPYKINGVAQYVLTGSQEHPATAMITLTDNENIIPIIWIDSVQDAVEGGDYGVFVLKRLNTSDPLTIKYTLSGTATNNTDYEYLSGSVTFAAGADTVMILVRPNDDTVSENTETVILTLTQPSGSNPPYTIDTSNSTATLSIIDATSDGSNDYNDTPTVPTYASATVLPPRQYLGYVNDSITVTSENGLLSGLPNEDDSLQAVLVNFSDTDSGTLVVNSDGSFVFTPTDDFVGTIQFTYAVTDSYGTSAPSTVTLVIRTPKTIAANDIYSVTYGQTLTVDSQHGFLANDFVQQNGSSDVPQISIFTPPEHGTIQLQQDGSFSYVGESGFVGEDTFVYRVTDTSGEERDATVTLRVTVPKPTPQGDVITLDVAGTFSVMTLLTNDFAPGTNISTMTDIYHVVVADGRYGTVTQDDDGTVIYTPQTDFDGIDVLNYQILDGDDNVVGESFVLILSNAQLTYTSGLNSLQSVPAGYNTDTTSDAFGELSVGGSNVEVGTTTVFVPANAGNWYSENTFTKLSETATGNQTETLSIQIISHDFGNGEWSYYEMVAYSYLTNADDNIYSGGYTSVLAASFIDGIYNFNYFLTVSDNFLINDTITDDTGTSSLDLTTTTQGTVTSTTLVTKRHNTLTSSEVIRTSHDTFESVFYGGYGTYSYATTSGSFTGTIVQSSSNTDKTSVDIVQFGDADNWTTTGSQSNIVNENWSNVYSGSGDYFVVEQDAGYYSETYGLITESGGDSGSLHVAVNGVLGTDESWNFTGYSTTSEKEHSLSSYEGWGVYTSVFSDTGSVFLMSGVTTENGSDSSTTSFSTNATL
ncbi:MAG: cadherin-like domain-containing protein, partial [Planctomycetaceae bacterium]|nr:cadherin-like domain-containing protein [Planctomycetaceae bacterium]